jgi:hypothetical protein
MGGLVGGRRRLAVDELAHKPMGVIALAEIDEGAIAPRS